MSVTDVPLGLFLSPGHSWARVDGTGRVFVGIDGFALCLLGPIRKVKVPSLGTRARCGEPLFEIEASGRATTILSPLAGVVCDINERLRSDPELVHRDPYHAGWIVSLSPIALAAGLRSLKIGVEARAWLSDEIERLRRLLVQAPSLADLAQDGGEISLTAALAEDPTLWCKIREQFFEMRAREAEMAVQDFVHRHPMASLGLAPLAGAAFFLAFPAFVVAALVWSLARGLRRLQAGAGRSG